MLVRCERCSAEYELDEGRVTEAGLSVKCSRCSSVFVVRKKAVVVTERSEAPIELEGPAAATSNRGPARAEKVPLVSPDEPAKSAEAARTKAPGAERPAFEDFSFPKSPGSSGAPRFEIGGMGGLDPGEPAFARQPPSIGPRPDSVEAIAAAIKRVPDVRVRPVLLLLVLGGVSYLAYRYFVWVPQRERQARVEQTAPPPRPAPPPTPDPRAQPPVASAPIPAPQTAKPPLDSAPAESKRSTAQARSETDTSTTAVGTPSAKAVDERPPAKEEPAAPPRVLQPNAPPSARAASGGATRPPATPEVTGNFDSYMEKADRLREREQPRAALEAYKKASELEPSRPEPFAGRGLALLDLGRTAPAIAAFEQALKIDSRYGIALMGLAEAHRAGGNKEQAVRYYEKYLALVPSGPEAQVAKAAIKALQE